jgi:hypothetical protein
VTLADGFHVDDMDGDIPTRTNTVIVTTMQAELEQDEFDPTLFHSTGGSWSMEYAYDNWADRTYNGGADGCILTEQASASLAGAWDDQSFLDLSYDPETLFATLSFAITPPGDVTQSTHCLNSNTGTFPAADLLVRAGVYVAQGHRDGDRIVFDFNEERTDQPLSTATRILRFQGRLSVSPASQ